MIAIEKITCYTHRPQEEGARHATGATRRSTGVVQGAGVQGVGTASTEVFPGRNR